MAVLHSIPEKRPQTRPEERGQQGPRDESIHPLNAS